MSVYTNLIFLDKNDSHVLSCKFSLSFTILLVDVEKVKDWCQFILYFCMADIGIII